MQQQKIRIQSWIQKLQRGTRIIKNTDWRWWRMISKACTNLLWGVTDTARILLSCLGHPATLLYIKESLAHLYCHSPLKEWRKPTISMHWHENMWYYGAVDG